MRRRKRRRRLIEGKKERDKERKEDRKKWRCVGQEDKGRKEVKQREINIYSSCYQWRRE